MRREDDVKDKARRPPAKPAPERKPETVEPRLAVNTKARPKPGR